MQGRDGAGRSRAGELGCGSAGGAEPELGAGHGARAATDGDHAALHELADAEKLAALIKVLEPFGIRELVQSGMVAIGRGGRSITERTLKPAPVPVPTVAG